MNTTRVTAQIVAELELLAKFGLESTQEGLKIHSNAPGFVIGAAQRLHEKGLISAADGGYLTDLGIEAARHLDSLLNILTPE